MNLLPSDLVSFVWGLLVAGLAAIASGFLSEAGKYLWQKVKPEPPKDVQVDLTFEPELYTGSDCRWVNEESLSRYEKDHFYYPHPSNGARCYRKDTQRLSYLMVNNNAKKQKA